MTPDAMVDAAVLVAMGEGNDGELRVILVRRAEWGPHGGQIAFPGGKREAHDPSLEHTALREAHEEIGLEPDAVGPLEALPIVEIQATQFRIHPFLGRARFPAKWRPSTEIAEVIEWPIRELTRPEAHSEQDIRYSTEHPPLRTFAFRVGPHLLWGASYRILKPLLSRLVQDGEEHRRSGSE